MVEKIIWGQMKLHESQAESKELYLFLKYGVPILIKCADIK